MRTVKVGDHDERLAPVYAMVPAPGELALAVWRLGHGDTVTARAGTHAHDFPLMAYSESSSGPLSSDSPSFSLAAGDLLVVAPGTVMGPFDPTHPGHASGWAVSFTAEVLGPDVPGSSFAWRTHPLLFPFVRGQATGVLRRSVAPEDRAEWSRRFEALARELAERRDGYREAAIAHLTLLLVAASRLATDVVDDLRVNQEPLLADVFEVIERHYAEPALPPGRGSRREPVTRSPHDDCAAPHRADRPGLDHRPADGGSPPPLGRFDVDDGRDRSTRGLRGRRVLRPGVPSGPRGHADGLARRPLSSDRRQPVGDAARYHDEWPP